MHVLYSQNKQATSISVGIKVNFGHTNRQTDYGQMDGQTDEEVQKVI